MYESNAAGTTITTLTASGGYTVGWSSATQGSNLLTQYNNTTVDNLQVLSGGDGVYKISRM